MDAPDTLAKFREWSTSDKKFSVGGLDLMEAGVPKGPSIKNVLNYLHHLWVEVSVFSIS